MVDIDPTMLAATVVIATVAIAAVAGCGSSKTQSPSKKKQQKKKQEPRQAPAEKQPAKKAAPKPTVESKVTGMPTSKSPAPQEVAAVIQPTVTATVSEEKKGKKAKETPEQRAARLERQKIAKQKKSEDAAAAITENKLDPSLAGLPAAPVPAPAPAPVADGWEVVADKRKQKPKKTKPEEPKNTAGAGAALTASEGALTAIDETTGTLQVEAKKVGILIGPKGATMHAIQDATDTKITMPKTDRDSSAAASVSVVGPAEGVAKALSIMRELCSKGYALALEGEGFQESSISVNSK